MQQIKSIGKVFSAAVNKLNDIATPKPPTLQELPPQFRIQMVQNFLEEFSRNPSIEIHEEFLAELVWVIETFGVHVYINIISEAFPSVNFLLRCIEQLNRNTINIENGESVEGYFDIFSAENQLKANPAQSINDLRALQMLEGKLFDFILPIYAGLGKNTEILPLLSNLWLSSSKLYGLIQAIHPEILRKVDSEVIKIIREDDEGRSEIDNIIFNFIADIQGVQKAKEVQSMLKQARHDVPIKPYLDMLKAVQLIINSIENDQRIKKDETRDSKLKPYYEIQRILHNFVMSLKLQEYVLEITNPES